MEQLTPLERGLDRRRFLAGTAGAVAGTSFATALAWPSVAGGAKAATLPVPEPIVSVLDPGLPIHIQLPGPPGLTLLYSQTPVGLFGLNVERTTVGNFKGDLAFGYLLGTATGSDGEQYGVELDVRVFEGMYQPASGPVQSGLFAMI
jgi:hypothetical protein